MNQNSNRKGVSATEVLVSALILLTVMTFITTLAVKVGQVWKDVGHQRVAVCELANQLELLTLLSPQQAEEAIKDLKASETCARTLQVPLLSGTLNKDELGTRVTLSINWKRRIAGKPVELSGWIVAADSKNEAMNKANKVPGSANSQNDEPPVPRLGLNGNTKVESTSSLTKPDKEEAK